MGERKFKSGATRDCDDNKLDYEAFISPRVLRAYAEYMHRARRLSDGSLRSGDDWQLGIPQNVYVKSLVRHAFSLWEAWRDPSLDIQSRQDAMVDSLGGIIFNAMGLWYERLKGLDEEQDSSRDF